MYLIYNVMLTYTVQNSDSIIHIHSFSHFFHYGLSQDFEYSFQCCTVEPCYFSIPYVILIAFICWSQTSNPPLPHSSPLGNHRALLYVCYHCFWSKKILLCLLTFFSLKYYSFFLEILKQNVQVIWKWFWLMNFFFFPFCDLKDETFLEI